MAKRSKAPAVKGGSGISQDISRAMARKIGKGGADYRTPGTASGLGPKSSVPVVGAPNNSTVNR